MGKDFEKRLSRWREYLRKKPLISDSTSAARPYDSQLGVLRVKDLDALHKDAQQIKLITGKSGAGSIKFP